MNVRKLPGVIAIAITAATVGPGIAGAAELRSQPLRPAPAAVERVLMIAVPGMTWRDLAGPGLPNLHRVVDGAAVADLSTRAPFLATDLAGNYASISAGDKAVGSRNGDGRSEASPGPAGRGFVVPNVEQIRSANQGTPFRAEVGAFGDALADAGWTGAVVGNADRDDGPKTGAQPGWAVAIAMMTKTGAIRSGEVGDRLLQDDPDAPFGVRLDPVAVDRSFAASWKPKSVVMVEASDLVRVRAAGPLVSRAERRSLRTEALRDTDALVGRLLDHVDFGRDAVVVVGTTPHPADGRLGVFAVHARGVEPGLLRSGTTQRTGFVQLMDVAPTVLDLIGVAVPDAMRGRPATVGRKWLDVAAREHFLVDADRAAEFRDQIREPAAVAYIVLGAALVIAIGLAGFRSGIASRALASWLALLVLSFNPAVYLARVIPFHTLGAGWYWGWVGFASVALAVGAHVVGRHHRLDPVLMLLATTVVVLGVDVVIGSPLQFNSALGFSPEIAGRFIGFGNAGYAAFGVAALLVACLAPVRWPGVGRRLAIAVLVGAILVDGAPFWGADVGGVLSLVPAFGLVVVRLMGWRLRWRHALWAAIGTVVVLAGAIAVDMSRPPESRTHLGRLVEQFQREGPGEVVDVVGRKLGMNLTSWSTSPFRILLPLVVLGFVLLWIAPGRPGATALRLLDPTRALTIGFSTLVILGYGLNDTGVLVPAVMGAIGLATVVPVALGAGAPAPGADYRRTFAGRGDDGVREWSNRS